MWHVLYAFFNVHCIDLRRNNRPMFNERRHKSSSHIIDTTKLEQKNGFLLFSIFLYFQVMKIQHKFNDFLKTSD